MNYISEGVYLGSLDDAYDKEGLKYYGITHILTVDVKPLQKEVTEGFIYKYVHAFDMKNEDLLSQLEECLGFVSEGSASGGVLVHCHAGRSRSATVVVAYLMRKFDMGLHDTLVMVKKQRNVSPNEGFMNQLKLFEEMGNKIDSSYDKFKLYKLNSLADKLKNVSVTDNADSLLADHMIDDPAKGASGNSEVTFKCKKCRRVLFKKSAVLRHNEGIGDAAFDWRAASLKSAQKGATDNLKPQCAQSLFIEPVQWMQKDVAQLEGKLTCPKCAAKLGSFNWSGERCPCGSWITPAFHIQISKVDECAPRQAVQKPGGIGARINASTGSLSKTAGGAQQEHQPDETVVK